MGGGLANAQYLFYSIVLALLLTLYISECDVKTGFRSRHESVRRDRLGRLQKALTYSCLELVCKSTLVTQYHDVTILAIPRWCSLRWVGSEER